jgi:hypothetical protein
MGKDAFRLLRNPVRIPRRRWVLPVARPIRMVRREEPLRGKHRRQRLDREFGTGPRTAAMINRPAPAPTATRIQPAAWTPARSLTTPMPSANGRNASHVSVPTPDTTPARTLDDTPSWSLRLTGMLSATSKSTSATCAATTATTT